MAKGLIKALSLCLLISMNGATRNSTAQSYTERDPEDFDNRNETTQTRRRSPTSDEGRSEWDEADMIRRQQEALAKRKESERKRKGFEAVRKTIESSESEYCSWKEDPLARIKGELCGSHYKVLNIDRKSSSLDKPQIKKAYRTLSLAVHPDKNPYVEDAEAAFNIAQTAYECLTDEECREEYDRKLAIEEDQIQWGREKLKQKVLRKAQDLLATAHYHISVAASHVFNVGLTAWEMAEQVKVEAFDIEWPVGQSVLAGLALWKGQFLVKIFSVSYLILRMNTEIIKYHQETRRRETFWSDY